jgi:hypothetical protein
MVEYLGPYLRPEIVDGLTAVIFKTLDSLMRRTSSKNSSEIMSYAVTMGKNGSIGEMMQFLAFSFLLFFFFFSLFQLNTRS